MKTCLMHVPGIVNRVLLNAPRHADFQSTAVLYGFPSRLSAHELVMEINKSALLDSMQVYGDNRRSRLYYIMGGTYVEECGSKTTTYDPIGQACPLRVLGTVGHPLWLLRKSGCPAKAFWPRTSSSQSEICVLNTRLRGSRILTRRWFCYAAWARASTCGVGTRS